MSPIIGGLTLNQRCFVFLMSRVLSQRHKKDSSIWTFSRHNGNDVTVLLAIWTDFAKCHESVENVIMTHLHSDPFSSYLPSHVGGCPHIQSYVNEIQFEL